MGEKLQRVEAKVSYSTCLFLERNRNAVDSKDFANSRTYD